MQFLTALLVTKPCQSNENICLENFLVQYLHLSANTNSVIKLKNNSYQIVRYCKVSIKSQQSINQSINQFFVTNKQNETKKQSEYVDRTQRQYETALTRALKIKKKHYNINLNLAILCLKQATVGELTI